MFFAISHMFMSQTLLIERGITVENSTGYDLSFNQEAVRSAGQLAEKKWRRLA